MNTLITNFLLFRAEYAELAVLGFAVLKSTVLLLVTWLLAALLWRRSACGRSWVWRLAFVGLLLLLVWQVLPEGKKDSPVAWRVERSAALTVMPQAAVTADFSSARGANGEVPVVAENKTVSHRTNWLNLATVWLPRLWAGIAALLAVWFLSRGWLGQRWLWRHSTAANGDIFASAENVALTVRTCATLDTPVLTGWFRPVVYLPEKCLAYDAAVLRVIFLHELAHWRRGDLWWQAAARLVCCLWWWQPLAWLAYKRLREEAEKAADDLVLLQTEAATDYAELLLSLGAERGEGSPSLAGLPMLGESPLASRIRGILQTNVWRGKIGAWTVSLLAAFVLLTALMVACDVGFKEKAKHTGWLQDLSQTGTLTVKIVDEAGKPVAHAEVRPCLWQGKDFVTRLWHEKKPDSELPYPEKVFTDNNGEVRIVYPLQVDEIPFFSIALRVSRPDFCARVAVPRIGKLMEPFVLEKGMRTTLRVKAPDGVKIVETVADVDNNQKIVPLQKSNSPREVNILVPSGTYTLRAMALDQAGNRYFSPYQTVVSEGKGERQLDLPLKSGVTVSGKLDDSVPRPVRKGRIFAEVVSPDGKFETPAWWVSSEVRPDGSFVLAELPEGNLSVVAISEGFVSKNNPPQPPKFDIDYRYSQKIKADGTPVVVAMEKTGSIKVKILTPAGLPLKDVKIGIHPEMHFERLIPELGSFLDKATVLRKYPSFGEMLFEQDQSDWLEPGPFSFTAMTDENGIATIENLPSGRRRLQITTKQYAAPKLPTAVTDVYPAIEIPVQSGVESYQEIKLEHKPDRPPTAQHEGWLQDLSQTGTLTVKVVDEAGKPVAHAEVRPYGLRAVNLTGHYGWSEDSPRKDWPFPEKFFTDAHGEAKVVYPPIVTEDLKTAVVSLIVSHPDFCPASEDIGVVNPREIRLQRGLRLTLTAMEPEGVKVDSVIADVQDTVGYTSNFRWLRSKGRLQSSVLVPKGNCAVRAVAFDRNGGIYFSDWQRVDSNGEGEKSLSFSLVEGVTISGKLDDSVPRPVGNGIVVAEVMDMTEAVPVAPHWEAYANINADGSFELRNLPPNGILSLVAISEGFVSKDPTSYNRSTRNPQQFKVDASQSIIVRMEPTGSVQVKVLKPDGKPLVGEKVKMIPSQSLGGSSWLIGAGFNRADILRFRLAGDDKFPKREERFKFEAVTDANGEAVIRNLPSGNGEWLWVNSELYDMPITSGGNNSPARHAVAQIVAGEETKLEIRMELKGTTSLGAAETNNKPPERLSIREQGFSVQPLKNGFSGKIVNAQGSPLAGVTVKIWSRLAAENKIRLAETDANGEFEIKDAPQGVAGLLVTKDGYGPVFVFSQIMGRLEQPLVLDNTTYLRGPLKDANDKPLDGATVTAILQSGDDIQFSTKTDANGDFKLFLSPGQYDISVKGDGVGGGMANAIITQGMSPVLRLPVAPLLIFKVVIRDGVTKQPLAGVSVKDRNRRIDAVSDADGKIVVSGLTAGYYNLTVEAEKLGYLGVSSPQVETMAFRGEISEKNLSLSITDLTPEVDIFLYQMVTVSGAVVDPQGKLVGISSIYYLKKMYGMSGVTQTEKDGRFVMTLPWQGEKGFRLCALGVGDWADGYTGVLKPRPGEKLKNVTIQLTRPCTIKGRVTDANGNGLARKQLRVFSLVDESACGTQFGAVSDDNGNFSFTRLSPEEYYVQVEPFSITYGNNGQPIMTPAMAKVTANPEKPVENVTLILDEATRKN